VELPPARVEESSVLVQFPQYKPFVTELVEELRAGTVADPVPVMMDGSTFAIHGPTRTFWVKLWHAAKSENEVIERVQIISCLPSTRGVQVVLPDADDYESDVDNEDEMQDDESE
jgi:hypothetical protein